MSKIILAWNSLAGVLYYLVSIATAFVMAPFLVHHLGNGGYGFWELIMGLVGYMGILDLGVAPAVMRHVALAWGKGNKEDVVKVVNTGFAAFLLAGLVGAALVLLVSVRPGVLFGKLPFTLTESREVLLVCSIVFLLTFTRATFTAALLGLQYHRVVNSVRAALTVIQAISIYLLLTHSDANALVKIASVSASSLLMESVIASILLSKILHCTFSPFKAQWTESKSLFRFGAKSVGLMSASSLTKEGLLFILSHALGAAYVTFYVLAARLLQYAVSLLVAVGFPVTPYLSHSFGHNGIEGIKESFEFIARIMQFLQGGLALGLLWLGMPFLSHWMGPQYAAEGSTAFYILVCGFFINILSSNSSRVLLSLNQHGKAATASIILALCTFTLAFFLVPKLGLAGAALAGLFFQVSVGTVQLVLVCRVLGLSVFGYIQRTLQRLSLPILVGAIAIAFTVRAVPPTSYGAIALASLTGGLSYLLVGFFTVPSSKERSALYALIRARLSRKAALVP